MSVVFRFFVRGCQVLPIWEGTTNILSLDVLRALAKSQGSALKAFHTDVIQRVAIAKEHPQLKSSAEKVQTAANEIVGFASQNADRLEVAAREFAYSLARTYMGEWQLLDGGHRNYYPRLITSLSHAIYLALLTAKKLISWLMFTKRMTNV